MRSPTALLLILVALILAAIQLPRLAFDGVGLYEGALSPGVVLRLSAGIKIAFLGVSAVMALRCARAFEGESAVGGAWRLLAIGLGGYFLGQSSLGYYQILLGVSAPFPSVADAFFIVGMVLIWLSLLRFLRAQVDSGMVPMDGRKVLVGGATIFVVLLVVALPLLAPVLTSKAPLAERLLNGAYPILDLCVATSALLLLRMALRMRGGRVAKVWGLLVGGFLFMVAADILFGYFSSLDLRWLEPVLDLLYACAYLFVALGTLAQAQLVSRPNAVA